MIKFLSIWMLFLYGCGSQSEAKQPTLDKYVSHFKKTGKRLTKKGAGGRRLQIYPGHRWGGDFKNIPDNTVSGALKVKPYENEPFFTKWETDINSAKDGLVNCHDWYLNDYHKKSTRVSKYTVAQLKKKKKCPALHGQLEKFADQVRPQKGLSLDLKRVSKKHFPLVLEELEYLVDRKVLVQFQTHCNKRKAYKDLIDEIKNKGFKITYYYDC